MKKIDDLTRAAICGCTYKLNGILWTISTRCPQHEPNWTKQVEDDTRRRRLVGRSKFTTKKKHKK
jgi:hypothetical protein